jgi:hypothetical protein
MLSSRALLNEWHYADAVGLCTLLARIHRPLRKHAQANMMRVARESVVIVDIHPEFQETLAKKPMNGEFFLMGEPYVLEYLTNIDTDVFSAAATHELGKSPWVLCHIASLYRLSGNSRE